MFFQVGLSTPLRTMHAFHHFPFYHVLWNQQIFHNQEGVTSNLLHYKFVAVMLLLSPGGQLLSVCYKNIRYFYYVLNHQNKECNVPVRMNNDEYYIYTFSGTYLAYCCRDFMELNNIALFILTTVYCLYQR